MKNAREEAKWVLVLYNSRFGELDATRALAAQLAEDQGDVFSRGNMHGHITTSALVVDEKCQSALLIHHNVFNRWVQPGGHFEPGEPVVTDLTGTKSWLWPSALREVGEETGLERVKPHPWSQDQLVPFDIDTHDIAENLKKQEAKHKHHDYLYLANGWSNVALKPQLEEVSAAKWVPFAHLLTLDARLQRVYRKLVKHRVVHPD